MSGQLFKQYFLTDGIRETPEWRESVKNVEVFTRFIHDITTCLDNFSHFSNPNEAVTEKELICPVLEALGWTDYMPQQGSTRMEDIPDHLLFADAEARARAASRTGSKDRYRDALVVQESKRFTRSLDNREQGDKVQEGTPHGQILRYLSTAEIDSEGNIRWGILTNGNVWRLYDQRTRPRATSFFEIDLQGFLNEDNEDGLRTFFLLFRRDAFVLRQGATATFLETALAEGRRYEEKVAHDLSSVVFDRVFPNFMISFCRRSGVHQEILRPSLCAVRWQQIQCPFPPPVGDIP